MEVVAVPTTANPKHRWACDDCAYTTDRLNQAREHATLTDHTLGVASPAPSWMWRNSAFIHPES